jgi:hypothetical protein
MLQHLCVAAALAEQRQADLRSEDPPRRHVHRWPWLTVLWATRPTWQPAIRASASAAPPIEGRR